MYINELSEKIREECRVALSEEQTKSLSETNNWSHVDRAKVHSDWDVLYKKMISHVDAADPSNEDVQKLIAEHYEIVSRFYVPSEKAYIGMALFYGENEGMKIFHTEYHSNMVNFVGDSICFYAYQKLKDT